MKLITLNLWGGHLRAPLMSFIEQNCDVDIFCFQEMYHNAQQTLSHEGKVISLNLFSDIKRLLPNHQAFFKPAVENVYGIGMFIKNTLQVLDEGEINIHEKQHVPGVGLNHARNLQWVECQTKDRIYSILNVHGLWNGQGKQDTPERIRQSMRIRSFMDSINPPKIICGDFNLRPDTRSMSIIEDGMINLITKFNIHSTRTHYYTKKEKYADYILTSPEVFISQFTVMKDVVSDHCPLFFEFE